MSDSRLRDLERRWRTNRDQDSRDALVTERIRSGALGHEQLYTAAYLNDPLCCGHLSGHLYDTTGEYNDHITGVCPCGWCRWDEGEDRWLDGLFNWGQNLPFKGIDEQHAEQEMAIRIGLGLAEAVWTKIYGPAQPHGLYVLASNAASDFLATRTEDARQKCRNVWGLFVDTDRTGNWMHQTIYHIIRGDNRRRLAAQWFRLSAHFLAGPCSECRSIQLQHDCGTCRSKRQFQSVVLARKVVQDALVPWILQLV